MKTIVQILATESRQFAAKKEGQKPMTLFTCQCVVHGEKVEVGVLKARDSVAPGKVTNPETGELMPAILPGFYEAEYGLAIHWETKELGGVLKSLTPVDPKTLAVPAVPSIPSAPAPAASPSK